MDTNPINSSSYNGTKTFDQWKVNTANATGFGAAADDYAQLIKIGFPRPRAFLGVEHSRHVLYRVALVFDLHL